MTRFNNLPDPEAIGAFSHFVVGPICDYSPPHEDGTEFGFCEIPEASAYGIFGAVENESGVIELHPVHDAHEVQEAIRVLAQIRAETLKPVRWFDLYHGTSPNRDAMCDFAAVTESLTLAIIDDLPEDVDERARSDAFDGHQLAPAREAFADFCDYRGAGTAADPYLSLDEIEAGSTTARDVRMR